MAALLLQNVQTAHDNQGAPHPGAKRYVYLSNSDTLSPIFADQALTIGQSNPMVADDTGQFGICHVMDGAYKVVITDKRGNILSTVDNISVTGGHALSTQHQFPSVHALLGDKTLGYSDTNPTLSVSEHDYITSDGGLFSYKVANPTAIDHHVETSGGVKLYTISATSTFNVVAFGAIGDGVADDTDACQAALDAAHTAGGGEVLFPDGHYATTGLSFSANVTVTMTPNAVLLAQQDDTVILTCTNALYSSIENVRVDGNGYAGVVGFEMSNFRHTSKVNKCEAFRCDIGFHLKTLCWNTTLVASYARDCNIGYLLENAANMTLLNCASNSSNSVLPVAGVVVRNGPEYETSGTRIIGGFHQDTARGIDDSANNTQITDVYFENCTESDIFLSGRFAVVKGTHHSANHKPAAGKGIVCIKARNAEAATLLYPALIGTRSDGLFDFDDSNTFCKAWKNESDTLNTLSGLGDTTGLSIASEAFRTDQNNNVSIGGNPVDSSKFSVLLDNGGDFQVTDAGVSTAIGTFQDGRYLRLNAPNSVRVFCGTAGSETIALRIEEAISYFYGQLQCASLATFADEVAATAAGLPAGRLYKTASGALRVKL